MSWVNFSRPLDDDWSVCSKNGPYFVPGIGSLPGTMNQNPYVELQQEFHGEFPIGPPAVGLPRRMLVGHTVRRTANPDYGAARPSQARVPAPSSPSPWQSPSRPATPQPTLARHAHAPPTPGPLVPVVPCPSRARRPAPARST